MQNDKVKPRPPPGLAPETGKYFLLSRVLRKKVGLVMLDDLVFPRFDLCFGSESKNKTLTKKKKGPLWIGVAGPFGCLHRLVCIVRQEAYARWTEGCSSFPSQRRGRKISCLFCLYVHAREVYFYVTIK